MTISSPRWQLLLLLLMSGVLFFGLLDARDIWDIDEGMHAATAQTMVDTGDWVTPITNGEAFFDKPPLFNWLTAVSFILFEPSEFSARVPAALSGLICVLLTWSLGRRMYDNRTGFLAAIVLATSLEFLILARAVQYDGPFTLFTTLALYCYAMGLLESKRRTLFFLGFYIAAALATLTKGPLGLVLPALIIGVHLLLQGKLKWVLQLRVLPGLLMFAVIVVPWNVLMEQANPGYLNYFILKQHFGNFLGGEGALAPRHPEPIYYYIPVILAGLLPWSAALPQAVARAWRDDSEGSEVSGRFLVAWLAVTLLFFSLATSKLATYVLPAFPACALMIARYLVDLQQSDGERLRRSMMIGVSCWLLPILLVSAYAIAFDPWAYWDVRSGIEWQNFEWFLLLFCVLLILPLTLFYLRRLRAATAGLALISPVLWLFILVAIVPGVNPYKGSKQIGLQIDYVLNDGQPIPMYGQLLDSTFFYTKRNGRVLHGEEELYRYLDSPDRRYVLIRSRARSEDELFTGNYHVIAREGNKAVVSNQPPRFP